MLDTRPLTTAIAAMIASGATSQQIVAALVRRFPDLFFNACIETWCPGEDSNLHAGEGAST
jgi:hypothetical protein